MGTSKRSTILTRVVAVGAGMLLVGSAFTGTAFATGDDGSDGQPPPSGVTQATTDVPAPSLAPLVGGGGSSNTNTDSTANKNSSSGASTDSPSTSNGSASNGATSLLNPSSLLPGNLPIPDFFPGTFPMIPGTTLDPADLAKQDPVTACANISSALIALDPTAQAKALQSPAALFCQSLNLLTGLPGTGTNTGGTNTGGTATETTPTSSYPYDYGSGGCYYSSNCTTGSVGSALPATVASTVPATATQVSSVPTGGVDTGDGSY